MASWLARTRPNARGWLGEYEDSLTDTRGTAESISSYVSAPLTIQVHPELVECTLDIVHCFYNIARHFSRLKGPFPAPIKLQILLVHVNVSFSGYFRYTCTCIHARVRARFLNLQSSRNPNSNVGLLLAIRKS